MKSKGVAVILPKLKPERIRTFMLGGMCFDLDKGKVIVKQINRTTTVLTPNTDGLDYCCMNIQSCVESIYSVV